MLTRTTHILFEPFEINSSVRRIKGLSPEKFEKLPGRAQLQQILVRLFQVPVSVSGEIFGIRAILTSCFALGRRDVISGRIQPQVNPVGYKENKSPFT